MTASPLSPDAAFGYRLAVRTPKRTTIPRLRVGVFAPSAWVGVESLVLEQGEELEREDGRHWQLVLSSRRIPCRIRYGGGTVSVQVPRWHAERAADEIRQWIRENPVWEEPQQPDLPSVWGTPWPTVAAMLVLVAFFSLTTSVVPGLGLYPERWLRLGAAQAMDILNGQYWRVFTALTLHADAAHVMGNAVVGGTFLMLLARRVGSGPAWFLTIAAGACGNWLNALAQSPMHSSIGFSTAVFGAAGILAGVRVFAGVEGMASIRSAAIPVAAGLGLLAMLGSGGENTDLGAHLFGFAAGVPMGVCSGWLLRRFGGVPRALSGVLAAVAVAVLPCAWLYARFS